MFKQKLETLVDFPLNGLDLTKYVINGNVPETYSTETPEQNGENLEGNIIEILLDKRVIYDLYAVSNHFGGLGGGHYTAYAKNHVHHKPHPRIQTTGTTSMTHMSPRCRATRTL